MRFVRFLRLSCALCLCGPALLAENSVDAAQPAACAPYRNPITLGFKTLAPRPVYNNRLTVQGIRNLF